MDVTSYLTDLNKVDFKTRRSTNNAIPEDVYVNFHTNVVMPTSIMFDLNDFENTMEKYNDYFKPWGTNRPIEIRHLRQGLPLVNLTGNYDDEEDITIQPLDHYWRANPGMEVFDCEIKNPTQVLQEPCFDVLNILKPYMVRSCILKWYKGGAFVPHLDQAMPAMVLRFWGTNNPSSIKLRFPQNPSPIKDKEATYIEYPVEAGRLYIVDTACWHDAVCEKDMGYQFFIACSPDIMNIAEGLKI